MLYNLRRGRGWKRKRELWRVAEMGEGGTTLEYTPTWVVALVCSVIVVISFAVERLLHYFGKACWLLKLHQLPLSRFLISFWIWQWQNDANSTLTDTFFCLLQVLKKKNQKPLFEALRKIKEGNHNFFRKKFEFYCNNTGQIPRDKAQKSFQRHVLTFGLEILITKTNYLFKVDNIMIMGWDVRPRFYIWL